ncbi:MAG: restriction endonuclease subunit S [Candidatus Margulisbacteria bacterium]|nr:restriction endonuclease subunit S [Candidatus Margulisiibacteriota bacterium]
MAQINWQIKKLGDVLKLEYGKPLHKSKRKFDGLYPVYGANGEKGRSDEFYFDKPSIIVGRKGSAGEINLTEGKFWPLDVTYYVTFDDNKCDLKFIYNLLLTLELPKMAKGVKPGINRNEVYAIDVKIPPLPEQRRIVKILNEIFEKAAKAKENAEKNLQNAKELFESYLQSVFTQPGKDWEESQMDELCEVEYGYTKKAKSKGDYRYVRITDTDENGLLTDENKMYIDSFDDVDKYILANDDLLMARTGASAGDVLLFQGAEKAVFASYLIRIKLKKEILSKLYWYYAKSKLYWDQVRQLSAGSAQPQFNGGALKQIVFPFPKSISKQESIVLKLDSLSIETKRLEATYKQKLTALEELKKSVLKRAFNGEL